MADFEEMYHILFNSITDAIETLKQAQAKAEELYIKNRGKTIQFEKSQKQSK